MLAYVLQGLILGASAAAQPGPLQAYLLSVTTRAGWRRALPAAFSPLISDGPILILVLVVLTAAPQVMLVALQIAGGLFLLYLAYGAFQAFRAPQPLEAADTAVAQQGLLKGALINFLSPNPYIFWATIAGPLFIEGWRVSPAYGIGFMAGFYTALVGGFMIFVMLFAFTGSLDPRLNRALNGLSAVALFLFGLFHLARGLQRLLVG